MSTIIENKPKKQSYARISIHISGITHKNSNEADIVFYVSELDEEVAQEAKNIILKKGFECLPIIDLDCFPKNQPILSYNEAINLVKNFPLEKTL